VHILGICADEQGGVLECSIEFIKDDIYGDNRNRRPISAADRLYVILYFLATDKVAMNDVYTFDALFHDHIGLGACCIVCLLMAIVHVVTF
jgi:hypothetical protein